MFMLFCKGLGVEVVEEWLKTDIVGCLQKFFSDCQRGDLKKDLKVLSPRKHVTCRKCAPEFTQAV